ncbi:MAG: 2-oxo acid dehydrogenase subunit E2, partial [Pseudobdellovibrionaceae bacterium]
AEISRQLTQKSEMVRTGKDKEINRSLSQLSLVPWRLMKTVLNVSSFLNYDFNWNLNFLGFPSDPFGSVMITNVGGMGVEVAWAPLVPFARVPLLLTVGAIRPTPWAVGNKVEVRPVMKIGVTFDHRFIDGSHAAAMSYQFKKCFEDPETYLV